MALKDWRPTLRPSEWMDGDLFGVCLRKPGAALAVLGTLSAGSTALLVACNRTPSAKRQPASPAVTPSASSIAATASAPDAGETEEERYGPSLPIPEPVTQRMRALRDALARGNREEFAARLLYPVRVGTMSWCNVRIHTPAELLAHYDSIVPGRVHHALVVAPLPRFASPQGVMFEGGFIWILRRNSDYWADPSENELEFSFSTDAWEVPGLQCEAWATQPIPKWLDGTWRVSSVTEVQGTGDPNPPTQWAGGALRIDLKHDTVDVALYPNPNPPRQRNLHCRPLRFGCRVGPPPVKDIFGGFESSICPGAFLHLECAADNRRWVEQVNVTSQTLLSMQGNDGFMVNLLPGKPRKVVRLARHNADCSPADVRCAQGLVCVSMPGSPGAPPDHCAAENEISWYGHAH